MNIEALKEKLGDATFAELKKYVDDLQGQRDAARTESIDGRKRLKAENESLSALKAKLFDKLGIDTEDDIATLPDAKGQAEAAKQFEAKLRRAEKALQDAAAEKDALSGKLKGLSTANALEKALGAHDWHDRKQVSKLLANDVLFEDGQVLYRTEDGKTIPLDEGVKLLASTNANLLKAQGASGSGHPPMGTAAAGAGNAPSLDLASIYAARQVGGAATQ